MYLPASAVFTVLWKKFGHHLSDKKYVPDKGHCYAMYRLTQSKTSHAKENLTELGHHALSLTFSVPVNVRKTLKISKSVSSGRTSAVCGAECHLHRYR